MGLWEELFKVKEKNKMKQIKLKKKESTQPMKLVDYKTIKKMRKELEKENEGRDIKVMGNLGFVISKKEK